MTDLGAAWKPGGLWGAGWESEGGVGLAFPLSRFRWSECDHGENFHLVESEFSVGAIVFVVLSPSLSSPSSF